MPVPSKKTVVLVGFFLMFVAIRVELTSGKRDIGGHDWKHLVLLGVQNSTTGELECQVSAEFAFAQFLALATSGNCTKQLQGKQQAAGTTAANFTIT